MNNTNIILRLNTIEKKIDNIDQKLTDLIKNNVIIYDQLKIDHLYKRFIKKEYVLIIIFIFFAFSWNPKTALSGDIGSFPIYRIPYKSIKMLL